MVVNFIRLLILFQYIWLNFKGSICVSHSRPDFFNERISAGKWPLLLTEGKKAMGSFGNVKSDKTAVGDDSYRNKGGSQNYQRSVKGPGSYAGGTYNPKRAWKVIDRSRQVIPTEIDSKTFCILYIRGFFCCH